MLTDDDDSFLSITKRYLEKYIGEDAIIETFMNDLDIIQYIERINSDYYSNLDIYQAYLNNHLTLEQALVEFELYRPILLIDQNLRGKFSGTDICKVSKDKYPNLSIILLTGEIDYITATQLHNENLIDYFFRKDETDLIKKLSSTILMIIEKRKKQFFFDGELSVNENLDILLDVEYRSHLGDLLSSYKYKSYMIINQSGDIAIQQRDNTIKLFQQFNNQGTFKEYGAGKI